PPRPDPARVGTAPGSPHWRRLERFAGGWSGRRGPCFRGPSPTGPGPGPRRAAEAWHPERYTRPPNPLVGHCSWRVSAVHFPPDPSGGCTMTPASKVVIRLTDEQRQALQALVRTGTHKAHARTRAQILLKADADGPDAWPDERVAEASGICRMTVSRVRQ